MNSLLLVADLTCEIAPLEQDILPGTGDPNKLRASFAKVGRLKERLPELEIVASRVFSAGAALVRASGNARTGETALP